jgi:hypothetical protein
VTGNLFKFPAPKPREDVDLHIPLVAILRWAIKPTILWRHVPNGEARDKRTAAKLKAMGTLAGSADLEFHWLEPYSNIGNRPLVKPGERRILHLELKVGSRKPSVSQVGYALAVQLLGDEYHVVRTIDEAVEVLGKAGLIRPGVEVCGRRW